MSAITEGVLLIFSLCICALKRGEGGGAVAQSGEEVPCSIPAVAARSLLVGSVLV